MKKRLIVASLILAILIISIVALIWHFYVIKEMMIKKSEMMKAPPIVVATAKAKVANWNDKIVTVGTLKAIQGIDISSELNGIVQEINFQSGQEVQKGQLLIVIKNKDLQSALEADESKLKLAQLTYDRYQKLFQKKYVSQSDVDTDRFGMKTAQALYDKDQAQYEKTMIKAPFSGKLGIKQIDVGQYITAGQPMVSLQDIKPILVDVNIPEKYISQLKVGGTIELSTNAFPHQLFTGKITALGAAVDVQTRTLQVQAQLPNDNSLLMPGMFAKVSVIVPQSEKVVIIPQTALAYNPYGDSVYVVKDGKAFSKYVTVGERFEDQVIIEKGLEANDEVVIAGQLKLHNGVDVKADNANK